MLCMTKVTLGRTGITANKNGFGALPVQRVGFDQARTILRKAYDNGIDFFDTARSYSDSEEKIGYSLSDVLGGSLSPPKPRPRRRRAFGRIWKPVCG